MEQRIETIMKKHFGRGVDQCTNEEIFQGLLLMTKEEMEGRPAIEGKKKVYYISAEFLIGKLLSNNLITARSFPRSKNASWSRLWAMAAWDVWRRASLTRSRRWSFRAMASD